MTTDYIVLCHKCAGLLTPANDKVKQAFGGCGCISGYIRDFQKALTIEQAKTEAIDHAKQSIAWVKGRQANGDDKCIIEHEERIEKIKQLN